MKFKAGINLGGYLSQCEHTYAHYRDFIKKEDIERIAGWGFDHIRIPIDYNVFETEEGEAKEEGFALVEQVLDWAREAGLNSIVDLHKAYGYDFNNAGTQANMLFSDEGCQQRFLTLWQRIAKRFADRPDVAFELLNEVVETEAAGPWNRLIKRAIAAIRKYAPDRTIIYGGIMWNSFSTLKLLEKPEDKNVIWTFHMYEPHFFTHQKAHWIKYMPKDISTPYPAATEYYGKMALKYGRPDDPVLFAGCPEMGKGFFQWVVDEAVEAAEKNGVPLYCGEFGVIDQAPVEDTLRWFRDVEDVFRCNSIGWALWTYKKMDFGLLEEHYSPVREDLLRLWNAE